MKKTDLDKLSNAELVSRFAEAARKRGLAALDLEVRKVNRLYSYMDAIHSILRARGTEARRELLPLLDNKDRLVRYFAAKQLLGIEPGRTREIIESTHKNWFDAIALDAGMTLYNLDTGVFKPD